MRPRLSISRLLGLMSPWIDALGVQEPQGLQGVEQGDPQVIQVQRLSLRLVLEAAPHQLQHELPALPHEVVDRHHVRVFQRRQQLGLFPVAVQTFFLCQELGVDLLDGHFAPQLAVPPAVDRGEVSGGDLFQDFVTIGHPQRLSLINSFNDHPLAAALAGRDPALPHSSLINVASNCSSSRSPLGVRGHAGVTAPPFGPQQLQHSAIHLPLCRAVAPGIGPLGVPQVLLIGLQRSLGLLIELGQSLAGLCLGTGACLGGSKSINSKAVDTTRLKHSTPIITKGLVGCASPSARRAFPSWSLSSGKRPSLTRVVAEAVPAAWNEAGHVPPQPVRRLGGRCARRRLQGCLGLLGQFYWDCGMPTAAVARGRDDVRSLDLLGAHLHQAAVVGAIDRRAHHLAGHGDHLAAFGTAKLDRHIDLEL